MRKALKRSASTTGILILTFFALAAIFNLSFEFYFINRIYPGVRVDGMNFGGKNEEEMSRIFLERKIPSKINFLYKGHTFTADTRDLQLRYDVKLMSERAYSVGRQTDNYYYNLLQKFAAVSDTINLPAEAAFDTGKIGLLEDGINNSIASPAADAQFKFDPGIGPDNKGRVVAFQQSLNGQELDRRQFEQVLREVITKQLCIQTPDCTFVLPVKTLYPNITTSKVNRLGIKDLLGTGVSYFYDSIPGRVENIRVGAEKINGSLIAPGDTFSFNNSIGTISAVFGFKKAYVIKDNKTVLDDGGGVCQVSTTLYRAVLNAGLPVTERVAHSYRVGFYEEGGYLPGLDATVYPPDPDFRFKNNTPNWVLLQSVFDPQNEKLSFQIFGTDDGRTTNISTPVILSTTPPPPAVYEDSPILPAGTLQQVDTAHWGATVYFTRVVTRNGETLINEKISSDYIPWPARFIRGTKS